MNTKIKQAPERQDIEDLLPWHAAGTLSRRDAQRIEEALTNDRELARRFELVREELGETIHLNETLGAPSARAMQKLFAQIEAEAPARKASTFSLGAWLTEFVSSFSPRTLAYSGIAAALAIMLQAAVITGVLVNDGTGGSSFTTASHQPAAAGSFAMVRFAPQATAADITAFLEKHQVSLVEGPKAGGMYKVKVAATKLPKEETVRLVKRIQDDSKVIVGFIAPVD